MSTVDEKSIRAYQIFKDLIFNSSLFSSVDMSVYNSLPSCAVLNNEPGCIRIGLVPTTQPPPSTGKYNSLVLSVSLE